MTDGVLIADAKGRFVQINDAFAKIYKFKNKDECSKSFDEIASLLDVFTLSGDPMPTAMWAVPRALRGERSTSFEYKIRRKDTGEQWTASVSFGPIRDANGLIIGAAISTRDITEHKRNETRLRRFYETDLFAILYWKIDGGVVDVNNKFLEMTGYSREDLDAGAMNWSEMTPPEYWPLDEDARRQIRETGVHLPYEKGFIRKDGTRVWGLFSSVAYEDNRDEGISFIVDITEQKRAEEQLRLTTKRFEIALQDSPMVVFNQDLDLRYTWIYNPALGYKADEVIGKLDSEIFERAQDAAVTEAMKREVISTGLRRRQEVTVHSKGHDRCFDLVVDPLRDADGRIVGVTCATVDITERKHAEEALLRSERLALQRKQLRALTAGLQRAREEERKKVARDLHDQIGQILTAVKMDLAWAARHVSDTQGEVHERLAASIELVNEGVRSVRSICSGLRPGVLDDLGLAAAVEWQANEFASRTGISVDLSLPRGEVRLEGERSTAVFRIFQECLTNVARHAEAKMVRTTLREDGDDLLMVVEDDGKGFSESKVASSLGLLGMKERAQACGGNVQVSSRPGNGTSITVRIPLRDASAEREDHANLDSR